MDILICNECKFPLDKGWDKDWLWCTKCRLFYWYDDIKSNWLVMTTAETTAFIMSGKYKGGKFEDYMDWAGKQAFDIYKIGLMGLLELSDEYGGQDNIPQEILDEYNLRLVQAMLWQIGLREDKPDKASKQ